jgi:hypothetical protein
LHLFDHFFIGVSPVGRKQIILDCLKQLSEGLLVGSQQLLSCYLKGMVECLREQLLVGDIDEVYYVLVQTSNVCIGEHEREHDLALRLQSLACFFVVFSDVLLLANLLPESHEFYHLLLIGELPYPCHVSSEDVCFGEEESKDKLLEVQLWHLEVDPVDDIDIEVHEQLVAFLWVV